MLKRQKVLLSLVQQAPHPLSKIVLFKYAFLLSKEWNLPSDVSFYDFVPYKYGPYSFALARELQALERYGYIKEESGWVTIPPAMEADARNVVRHMPPELHFQASSLISKYRNLGQQELLRQVYREHPSFTFRSKLSELIPPSSIEPRLAPRKIYTLGYEGKSIDGFLNLMIQGGLKKIIDVRANPVSRKYGFAKSTMSTVSARLGIEYLHIPALGIPSRDRRGLGTTLSYTTLLNRYESQILPVCSEPRRMAMDAINMRPSVLVCMEENAEFCHRGRLANSLALESGLPIQHL